jgi:uncharacterized protein YjiS (DUF1127 family)
MFKVFETLRQWRSKQVAIAALNQMDDHMLSDIGIRRGDISKYVRGLK